MHIWSIDNQIEPGAARVDPEIPSKRRASRRESHSTEVLHRGCCFGPKHADIVVTIYALCLCVAFEGR